jgi:hypothetical protein
MGSGCAVDHREGQLAAAIPSFRRDAAFVFEPGPRMTQPPHARIQAQSGGAVTKQTSKQAHRELSDEAAREAWGFHGRRF